MKAGSFNSMADKAKVAAAVGASFKALKVSKAKGVAPAVPSED